MLHRSASSSRNYSRQWLSGKHPSSLVTPVALSRSRSRMLSPGSHPIQLALTKHRCLRTFVALCACAPPPPGNAQPHAVRKALPPKDSVGVSAGLCHAMHMSRFSRLPRMSRAMQNHSAVESPLEEHGAEEADEEHRLDHTRQVVVLIAHPFVRLA